MEVRGDPKGTADFFIPDPPPQPGWILDMRSRSIESCNTYPVWLHAGMTDELNRAQRLAKDLGVHVDPENIVVSHSSLRVSLMPWHTHMPHGQLEGFVRD